MLFVRTHVFNFNDEEKSLRLLTAVLNVNVQLQGISFSFIAALVEFPYGPP